MPRQITRERAERIARSHHCPHCLEYSFKRIVVTPASAETRRTLKEAWHIERTCGVCGLQQEMGVDGAGELLYDS